MQIENHLQPNCSDLVLMISPRRDTAAIEDTIKTIRSLKLNVSISSWDAERRYASKLSSEMLAVIMKDLAQRDGALTNVDKLKLIGEMRSNGVAETEITQAIKELTGDVSFYVVGKKGDINFRLSDGYGGEGICVMTGDCEQTAFPILKKIQEKLGGEVYSVDGGHIGAWEEYLSKEDNDE